MPLLAAARRRLDGPLARLSGLAARLRDTHRLPRPDFADGGATLVAHLRTHRACYARHVGAQFLLALHDAGPAVLEGFARRHGQHGWHFPLTREEARALRRARDATSTRHQISHLRYATNVVDQVLNRRQFGRMLALGAAAGSAGLLLAFSEVFLAAKRAVREALGRLMGLQPEDASEFVALARELTAGAVTPAGTLDATLVVGRVEVLVHRLEEAGGLGATASALSHDLAWFLGVLSGVVLLVLGRGLLHLVMEGMGGTVWKIDALVEEIDRFAEWTLGRPPRLPERRHLPGDLILPRPPGHLDPRDPEAAFRAPPDDPEDGAHSTGTPSPSP